VIGEYPFSRPLICIIPVSDIAEIWENVKYQNCGNLGKNCGNLATYRLRKSGNIVDIKSAEIWEKNAEIWQLTTFHMRNSGNLLIFLNLRKYGKMLRNCGVFPKLLLLFVWLWATILEKNNTHSHHNAPYNAAHITPHITPLITPLIMPLIMRLITPLITILITPLITRRITLLIMLLITQLITRPT
jgi:hypothetical protein